MRINRNRKMSYRMGCCFHFICVMIAAEKSLFPFPSRLVTPSFLFHAATLKPKIFEARVRERAGIMHQ